MVRREETRYIGRTMGRTTVKSKKMRQATGNGHDDRGRKENKEEKRKQRWGHPPPKQKQMETNGGMITMACLVSHFFFFRTIAYLSVDRRLLLFLSLLVNRIQLAGLLPSACPLPSPSAV